MPLMRDSDEGENLREARRGIEEIKKHNEQDKKIQKKYLVIGIISNVITAIVFFVLGTLTQAK